jgi:hypothetical protein
MCVAVVCKRVCIFTLVLLCLFSVIARMPRQNMFTVAFLMQCHLRRVVSVCGGCPTPNIRRAMLQKHVTGMLQHVVTFRELCSDFLECNRKKENATEN